MLENGPWPTLNGIINGQVGSMAYTGEGVEIISTNSTSLRSGFYIFMIYTILGMFLAGFLKSKTCEVQESKMSADNLIS